MRNRALLCCSRRGVAGTGAAPRRGLQAALLLLAAAAIATGACSSDVSGGSGASSSSSSASSSSGGDGGSGGCVSPGAEAVISMYPDWTKCDGPGQCALRIDTCCPSCGGDPLESSIAVRMDSLAQVTDAVCASACTSLNDCPDIGCPSFVETYNVAVCRSGSCKAVDIRQDELTACSADADCALRWGVACCETCGAPDPSQLVAVRASPSYSEAVCDPMAPCPPCAPPPYPSGAAAICDAAGHCEVKLPM